MKLGNCKSGNTVGMKGLVLALVLLCFSEEGMGYGLTITNATPTGYKQITCKVKWEGSWFLDASIVPGNHDAVWLFAKVKVDGLWKHLKLDTALTRRSVTNADFTLDHSYDGTGLMLKRSKAGTGSTGELEVTFGYQSPVFSGFLQIAVYGIEMVYISPGGYWLGDSSRSTGLGRSGDGGPFKIEDEGEIILGAGGLNDTGKFPPAGDIPNYYPKGTRGFYCMKYEISQEQYKDFLNTLAVRGQIRRTESLPWDNTLPPALRGSNRNNIRIGKKGTYSVPAYYVVDSDTSLTPDDPDKDGLDIPCNWLMWADLVSYLDWAALRPMSELEYEKICRGPSRPVKDEFAWGTNKIVDANILVNAFSSNETVAEDGRGDSGLANHGYVGVQGPIRSGFAASKSTSTGRISAGAGYYGTMEMSGNLWELCVNVCTPEGLRYSANHGDGNMADSAMANVTQWPKKDGIGAGYRGGGWNSGIVADFRDLSVSDRFYMGQPPSDRRATTGGRGVRSIPF